jgi:hypothetical protein
MCVYVCVCVYIYAYICSTRPYIYTYIHTHTAPVHIIYIYIYIYAYIHIYIYIMNPRRLVGQRKQCAIWNPTIKEHTNSNKQYVWNPFWVIVCECYLEFLVSKCCRVPPRPRLGDGHAQHVDISVKKGCHWAPLNYILTPKNNILIYQAQYWYDT